MSGEAKGQRTANVRGSTIGRPRTLTDKQVAAILAWHESLLAWKAQRGAIKTLRQFAEELGVTHGAITSVIRQRGVKQASPVLRETDLGEGDD